MNEWNYVKRKTLMQSTLFNHSLFFFVHELSINICLEAVECRISKSSENRIRFDLLHRNSNVTAMSFRIYNYVMSLQIFCSPVFVGFRLNINNNYWNWQMKMMTEKNMDQKMVAVYFYRKCGYWSISHIIINAMYFLK